MIERHRATVGVFGIPQDEQGRGLWSRRTDGKGINAIGGAVDPEDAQNQSTLIEVLKREFREEAGVEIEVLNQGFPLGVFPTANLSDLAILYSVKIVSGEPEPTAEAIEHIWMTPEDIVAAADRYDGGDKANGLLSGRDKRQWQMAKTFFTLASTESDYQRIVAGM